MTPALVLLVLRWLLAVLLYAFLATLLIYLWRDVRAVSAARSAHHMHTCRLSRVRVRAGAFR